MVKNLSVNGGDARDVVLIPGLGRFPSSRKWQSAPVFLPEKFYGQRALRATVHGVTKSLTQLSD